jgi:NAD(P)-dependent dehydrogenase (short-subunit alcohol dehydrogenase family)
VPPDSEGGIVGRLTGKVAVVTGASRGIGRGIAIALEAEGAAVYPTGRTAIAGSHELPRTVGETAAEIDRRGGTGVAVQVDHADDAQVAARFARISQKQGRLGILVKNAFSQRGAPIWRPIAEDSHVG